MDRLVELRTFVMDRHVDHGVINQMSLGGKGGVEGGGKGLPGGKLCTQDSCHGPPC